MAGSLKWTGGRGLRHQPIRLSSHSNRLYAFDQPGGEPPLYRLAMRLVNPVPDDLENVDGRQLESRAGHPWEWEATAKACLHQGLRMMDLVDRSLPIASDTLAG